MWLLVCVVALMVATGVRADETPAVQAGPNIVIYMIDDLGWNQISAGQGTMGTHTGEFLTPHLEKLAARGLSFTQAYMQPNCAPTRAALLSGQYPARVNNDVYVVGNLNRNKAPGITKEEAKFKGPKQSQDVAAEAITIAEALKQNGYATAHIGKYHVGGHDGDEATLPENQGFDINIGGFHQGHQPVCFAKQVKGAWTFPKLGRGDFDRFAEPYTKAYVEKYGIPASQIGKPRHVCDALADAMEETINKLHADGEPFYLQLHAYAAHGPVKARPDLKAAALKRLDAKGGKKAELAGFIAGMDNTLGRLMAALEDPNADGDAADSIVNNTLVIFTSDNGGKRYKLLYFYEADEGELYDLSDDIGEEHNVIQTKPELAAELSKAIRAWLTQEHPTWKPKYPLDKQSGKPVPPPTSCNECGREVLRSPNRGLACANKRISVRKRGSFTAGVCRTMVDSDSIGTVDSWRRRQRRHAT